MVQKALFRVTLGADRQVRAVRGPGAGFRELLVAAQRFQFLENRVYPQKFQPVSVRFARRRDFLRSLADSTGNSLRRYRRWLGRTEAASVVPPQLPPQEEVGSQPAVEVLNQTAGPHHPIG